jgi:hypothetical protein
MGMEMNERIKELAEQATIHGNTEHHMDIPMWYLEKFAQLIVRECLEILDGEDDYGYESRGVRIAAYRMKKHFGVE